MSYIATDLELEAGFDLGFLVLELGEGILINLNQWVDGNYCVAMGISGIDESPESSIQHYCSLFKGLSFESKVALDKCSRRILDIGFESGNNPWRDSHFLPCDLVRQASDLGFGIIITIYPVGTYWT